jgi:hypothetical protein
MVGSRRDGSGDGGAPVTAASLPAPTDPSVRLSVAGGELAAVLRFAGYITPQTAEAARQQLLAALEKGAAVARRQAGGAREDWLCAGAGGGRRSGARYESGGAGVVRVEIGVVDSSEGTWHICQGVMASAGRRTQLSALVGWSPRLLNRRWPQASRGGAGRAVQSSAVWPGGCRASRHPAYGTAQSGVHILHRPLDCGAVVVARTAHRLPACGGSTSAEQGHVYIAQSQEWLLPWRSRCPPAPASNKTLPPPHGLASGWPPYTKIHTHTRPHTTTRNHTHIRTHTHVLPCPALALLCPALAPCTPPRCTPWRSA